jgi:inosine/xanthosine triphosphate pyrophosphatase family protein
LIKRDLTDESILSKQTKYIMKTCTFVTGNPNKVIEVNAILGDSIPIRALALDIPEIQGSLEDIARDKCRRAAKIVTSLLPD